LAQARCSVFPFAMASSDLPEELQQQLAPFIEVERRYVELADAGDHEGAVRALETVLRQEQAVVQQMQDTVLSSVFERLAVGYNTLGMKYLKEGDSGLSLKFFQKADALTDPANLHMNPDTRLVLRAVTYNNFGCFYKSLGKLHTALQYLKRAQAIEEKNEGRCQNPAGTQLNLCALLSQMGKHGDALVHAQRALYYLHDKDGSAADSGAQQGESLVCVAYFNMGAEYEHLRKWPQAIQAYERALQNCGQDLGDDHPLTQQVAASLKQVRSKVPR